VEERTPLSNRLYDWLEASSGWFYLEDIHKALNITGEADKANIRVQCSQFAKKGILDKDKRINGRYRRVDKTLVPMDLVHADAGAEFPMTWPFDLERYVRIMPKSIIVIAGSPNSGKTTFLLNVVARNQGKQHIPYFNSEMAAEEFKLRLDCFENVDGWCFEPYERSGNYADVIFPDALNIIDFMEINDEFYKIAGELQAIHEKLNKGICIVAIQKNPSKKDMKGRMVENDMGRGGTFGLEKPRLYLSMDYGRLKVVKAKIWKKPTVNPNGMVFNFKLVNGAHFTNITEKTEQDGIGF
jgi:hypothetical protein